LNKILFAGAAFAASMLIAGAASATSKVFEYDLGGSPIATGSFSYLTGATGVLGYGDLTAFSITVGGHTYSLADVLPLTDYVHFAYDTGANVFNVDPNSCGFAGCGFQSSLSAINSAGTFGFFFNGAPGGYHEYAGGQGGSFDTIKIGGVGVPEPATWALMLGGFGLIGVTLRRRRESLIAA
jgi:hypothetical protein